MKIYTRLGDKGTTSLVGGKRVDKHHIRVEAYGCLDELMAQIALVRDQETDTHNKEVLLGILRNLMTCTNAVASQEKTKVVLTKKQLQELETEIDKMQASLKTLKSFILPGGHPKVSQCHIARTVCRRAERRLSELAASETVHPSVSSYLNRLSDYLFVLSRFVGKKLKIPEMKWK
jgi:cob(I)alamin adenosyltransferase